MSHFNRGTLEALATLIGFYYQSVFLDWIDVSSKVFIHDFLCTELKLIWLLFMIHMQLEKGEEQTGFGSIRVKGHQERLGLFDGTDKMTIWESYC